MQFEPNGYVELIKDIPWHGDYGDVRLFGSLAEQTAWFTAKPRLSFDNCSYTRASAQYVAVNENIEQLWQYNYLRFQNANMGTKWFYAFIDRLEYRAAKTTYVYFTIDEFQTWMFDFTFAQCMIDRQHVGTQAVGDKYFLDEGLDYGTEYETVYEAELDSAGITTGLTALLISSIDLSEDFGSYENPALHGATGVYLNQLPSGCDYYVVNTDVYGDASLEDVFRILADYPWACKGILGLTLIPTYMLAGFTITNIPLGGTTFYIGKIQETPAVPPIQLILNENIFSLFESVPNPKLLMYPYAFVELTLQNGQSLIIKPQYLNDTNLTVNRTSVVGGTPEVKYTVEGYQGEGNGYNFSLSLKDFPQLPVLDTSYMLTQSYTIQSTQQNQIVGIGQYILSLLGGGMGYVDTAADDQGVPSLGGAMGWASGAMNLYANAKNARRQIGQANVMTPTLATQVGGSGFNMATNKCCLTVRWKQIAAEYRDMIGDFLNRFGLRVNSLETPNPNKMTRFDYLKTTDCRISAEAPQDSQMAIINAVNRGVTFWHDDNIGNFDNNAGKAG